MPLHAAISELVRASLLIVGALFPIVDSPDNIPIFLTLTRGLSAGSRTVLARKIAVNSFGILIVSVLIGTHILAFFGISLPVVQVGGGLIVTAVGWKLLNRPDDDAKAPESSSKPLKDAYLSAYLARRAFYPLTMPLTVGPGSISVAIAVGASQALGGEARWILPVAAFLGCVVIAGSIYLMYPLCRANRAHCRRDCNECYLSLVGVHSRLYRRTDRVEWNECATADDPRPAAVRQAGDVFYSESEQPGCLLRNIVAMGRARYWFDQKNWAAWQKASILVGKNGLATTWLRAYISRQPARLVCRLR